MPHGIFLHSKKYTITMELSATGDGSAWPVNQIPLDYHAGGVTGIWANAAGTGTDFWNDFPRNMVDGNWIQLGPEATAASTADTSYWVTYIVDTQIIASGVPLPEGGGVIATAPTILSGINGTNDSATPVNYEISGLATGQTLAAEIPFVPPLSGVVITQIEVNTDGTNIEIGIYPGGATTGTTANIKFAKTGINQLYNSSTEFPNLRIVIEDDAWRLGVVDTGVNATPAGTTITVRGYPLI